MEERSFYNNTVINLEDADTVREKKFKRKLYDIGTLHELLLHLNKILQK